MIVEFTQEDRERMESESSEEQQIEAEEQEQQIEAEELTETEETTAESSNDEDDDAIPFTYFDETEGKEKVINISYDRLSKIVEDHVKGRSIEEEAQRMAEYLQQVNPLIEHFSNSDLLKQIAYYQSQGYDDETIKRGLVKLWATSPQPQTAGAGQSREFESPQDELNYYIEKQLEEKLAHYLKPFQTKIETLADAYTGETIEKTNNKVLAKALERYDISEDNITKEDIELFNRALMDAYPNIDLRRHPLSQQQAYIVANEAFRHRKASKKPVDETKVQKIKNALKQASAPTIMPGKGARQTGVGIIKKLDGVPDTERRKNWIDLIS